MKLQCLYEHPDRLTDHQTLHTICLDLGCRIFCIWHIWQCMRLRLPSLHEILATTAKFIQSFCCEMQSEQIVKIAHSAAPKAMTLGLRLPQLQIWIWIGEGNALAWGIDTCVQTFSHCNMLQCPRSPQVQFWACENANVLHICFLCKTDSFITQVSRG